VARCTGETLLSVHAVVSCICFVFQLICTTFSNVEVESTGLMTENDEGIWSFEKIELKVKVTIDNESEKAKIGRAIEMAHKTCPVANTLKCPTLLDYEIVVA